MTPCSLFLKRQIRTRFDLLKPNQESHVTQKQAQQKTEHDRHSKRRDFSVGQKVMAKNFRSGPKWIPAVIDEKLGPLSYLVKTVDGELWRRHVDHLKEVQWTEISEGREESSSLNSDADSTNDDWDSNLSPTSDNSQTTESPQGTDSTSMAEEPPSANTTDNDTSEIETAPTDPIRRYPTRDRQRPSYYGQTPPRISS